MLFKIFTSNIFNDCIFSIFNHSYADVCFYFLTIINKAITDIFVYNLFFILRLFLKVAVDVDTGK